MPPPEANQTYFSIDYGLMWDAVRTYRRGDIPFSSEMAEEYIAAARDYIENKWSRHEEETLLEYAEDGGDLLTDA